MRKLILSFLLILPLTTIPAQSDAAMDSLQRVLAQKRAARDRMGEAEALNAIAAIYYNQQQDSLALAYTTEALQRLPEGRSVLKGRLLYRQAMLFYFTRQDLVRALPLLDSAYALLKASNDPALFGPFLQSYGPILSQNLQCQKALNILTEAEQVYLSNKAVGTTDRLLNVYSNLLSAAYMLGDYQRALAFARKGIEVGKVSDNYELVADLYYNNALTLSALGYEQDAEQNYLKSLELNRKGKVAAGIVTVTTALGDYYCRHNQAKRGFQYLDQAKAAAAQAKDFYAVAVAQKIAAAGYASQKDYARALAEIDSCIRYFETTKDSRMIQGMYLEKASTLKDNHQPEEAIMWANKELDLARQTSGYAYIYSSYQLLSDIEKERGHFEQALRYHEQYAAYKDSVYSNDLKSKLAEERTRQNVEAVQDARQKAEREAALLNTQNRLFLALGAALLTLLAAGAYFFRKLRRAKNLLDAQNLQLAQLNQAKDKFFGIIAHDLRNPLSAFQGVGEQLRFYLEKGDTAKLHKITGLIAKSAASLSALLDNLLSWALLNRGMIPYSPEPLTLSSEIAANFDIHENAAAAKGIQLESSIPPDLLVQADRNALQAILRNLVGNAVKFTPPGGRVTLGCAARGDKVCIVINDTGTGIAAEKLDKLFTLDKRATHGTAGEKGAGLGLLLCKELVELNRGMLRVFSTEGKGSTVEFSLPAC